MEWVTIVIQIIEMFCDKSGQATDDQLRAAIKKPEGVALRVAAREKAKEDGRSPLLWRRYVDLVEEEAARATEAEVDELIATYRARSRR